MSCCSPAKPPRFFTDSINSKAIVNDVFFAAYNDDDNQWYFPVFYSANDYTGNTKAQPFKFIAYGQTYSKTLYIIDGGVTKTSSQRPMNVPVLVTQSCSLQCVMSSSENIEQEAVDNMLMLVQNGSVNFPLDSYSMMLYEGAKNKIFYNYVCTSGC